jgi:RHS repeat-associated protein
MLNSQRSHRSRCTLDAGQRFGVRWHPPSHLRCYGEAGAVSRATPLLGQPGLRFSCVQCGSWIRSSWRARHHPRRCLWGLDLAGQRSGSLGQEAGGIGGLLAFTVTSNNVENVYLPIADAMGNIHKIVDATTGVVAAEYDYDPFGKPISEAFPNSRIPEFAHFPFRFQSKYYDAETGLYYFGYRYYDPASCKWLCRDPLQEQGGINLTAYCSNDPVNKIDPLGLAGYFFGGTSNCLEDEGISNVEILYLAWRDDINGKRYYVPGVFSGYNPDGTKKKSVWAPSAGWLANPLGTILGKGASHGLEGLCGKTTDARVDQMMLYLEQQLKNKDKVVNLFGFSRGSTSALEFLNRIQAQIKARNPLYRGIKINYVALWDTVKSTAANYRTELPKGMKFQHNPLHFIAIDEGRIDFFDEEVLNLQGALQIGFRGVHADAGNGYRGGALGWPSLDVAVRSANLIGLQFNIKTLDQYTGPFDLSAKPTKNGTCYYRKGGRIFPPDMYLDPSVSVFNESSQPLNDISDLPVLPEDALLKWKDAQPYYHK